jgi:hypothetical protein
MDAGRWYAGRWALAANALDRTGRLGAGAMGTSLGAGRWALGIGAGLGAGLRWAPGRWALDCWALERWALGHWSMGTGHWATGALGRLGAGRWA